MSVSLDIRVEDAALELVLARLETGLSGAGIATFLGATVDPYLRDRARARFQAEGDDAVGRWLPLASATQEIRQSQGYGPAHPINHRTGELERYITDSPNALTITPVGASLDLPGKPATGELQRKVRVAQQGDPGGSGQGATPPRPVMGVSEKDIIFVQSALSIYLGEMIRR